MSESKMASVVDVASMTESEGFDLIHALRHRFGWAIRVVTKADAESAYEGSDAEGEFTAEEWDRLRSSRAWRDVADMSDYEWEEVHSAVYTVLGLPSQRAEASKS